MQLPKKTRTQVFSRDGNKCIKCKSSKKSLHVHHIVPTVFGGSDELSNLTTLCFACHEEWHAVESASNFPFTEWLEAPTISAFLFWHRLVNVMKSENKLANCSGNDLCNMLEIITSRLNAMTEGDQSHP